MRGGWVAAFAVALLVYNNLVGGLVPAWLYVPVNIVLAAVILVIGRRAGLGPGELGGARSQVAAGARWGGFVVLVAVAALALVLAIPALRAMLEDARVEDATWGLVLYRALIRIPLGTVLLEEVAFRGVLFGAWERFSGMTRAIVGSSLVFGLWHIRPTLDLLRLNELAEGVVARSAAVAGGVAITAVAGVVFALLRVRSGSLIAPAIAHAGLNSTALVAAYVALQM